MRRGQMDATTFIAITGIVALVAALVLYRKRNSKKDLIEQARMRAKCRTDTKSDGVPFMGGMDVDHRDELTESQFAAIQLIDQGFRPEIRRPGYRYTGAPRNRIAGVPDHFGKEND